MGLVKGTRLFPLTPALSLGERENRQPRFRQSRAPRLLAARDAVFPLPAGEGQGEGNETPPTKTLGRILQAQLDQLPESKLAITSNPMPVDCGSAQSQGSPIPGCRTVEANSPSPRGYALPRSPLGRGRIARREVANRTRWVVRRFRR